MAEGRSYGDLLREARERQGIDLVSMARALHIRPDIVGAIESADFNKMPAHGYTKNMVRAYARQMGLDEAHITQMYAEARNDHEGMPAIARGTRQEARSQRLDGRSRRIDGRSRRIDDGSSERPRAHSQSIAHRSSSPSRTEARSRSLDERSSSFSDMVSSFSSKLPERDHGRVHSSFTQGGQPLGISGQVRRGEAPLVSSRSLPALNLPVILAIAGAVLIIIIAVILFNGGKQSVDDVPDIPISGLTDTSAVDESEQAPRLATAPSSAIFSFSVEEGAEVWVSVYMDGSSDPEYAAIAKGPVSEDFEVTGTLTFETPNITPITLTVDGEEVDATLSSATSTYVYTVDFPAILYDWKKEHGMLDSDDDNDASEAASNASSSSSTSNTSNASKSTSNADASTSNAQKGTSSNTSSASNASSASRR